MHALSVLLSATREQIELALPNWSTTRTGAPLGADRTATDRTELRSGGGSYAEALGASLPPALVAVPHAFLKNAVFRHMTAMCWAMGIELRTAPQPFLFPPENRSGDSLHHVPLDAIVQLAKAKPNKLASIAKRLSKSAVFTEFGSSQDDALALLNQALPIAEATVANRCEAYWMEIAI